MNINQIYYEFSKHESKKYYVQLAYKEVMVIPVLIDTACESLIGAHWAEDILEAISEEKPELLYSYFDYYLKIVDKNRGLVSWRMWKIISKVLKFDFLNKWELAREKYYAALYSESLSEFSVACSCVSDIINNRPEEKQCIIAAIKDSASRCFNGGDLNSETVKSVALERAEETLAIINSL